MSKNNSLYIILGIVLLLIIGFVIWNFRALRPGSDLNPVENGGEAGAKYEQPQQETSGSVTLGYKIGPNAIVALDQNPGDSVEVRAVVLEKPGFVVIHEDEDGRPGSVLGVSELLGTGNTDNIQIDLNRSSVAGEGLYAMLHSDDGDESFNIETDLPVKDVDGNTIMMFFPIVPSTPTEDIIPSL